MNKSDRDKIFEEYGYHFEKEISMGVGIWVHENSEKEGGGIYIIAKYMGTWNYFTMINASSSKEAALNEDSGVIFKITDEKQFRTILNSCNQ